METIGEINKELENLNTQIEQYTLKNTRAKDMAARAKAFKSVADSWEFMSFNERQKTVREYIKKIKISNDYVEIEYNDLFDTTVKYISIVNTSQGDTSSCV